MHGACELESALTFRAKLQAQRTIQSSVEHRLREQADRVALEQQTA